MLTPSFSNVRANFASALSMTSSFVIGWVVSKRRRWLEIAACRQTVVYGLAKAAASEKLLAGEPGGVVRSQKDSDGGDVARLADAAERSLRDDGLLEVRADEAAAVGAFGLDHAGIDGVDPDLLRAELAGEHAGDGVDRALGAGVNRAVRRRDAAGDGADVDDAAAFAEVLDGGLRGEQKTEHVDVEMPVELLFGDGLDGSELVHAGVVDEDVEAAVVLDGCVDDALAPRRLWRRRHPRRRPCHRLR